MKKTPTSTEDVGRGRGRPKIGGATTARLTEDEHEFATKLGDGKIALGIRRALHIAMKLPAKQVKELMSDGTVVSKK